MRIRLMLLRQRFGQNWCRHFSKGKIGLISNLCQSIQICCFGVEWQTSMALNVHPFKVRSWICVTDARNSPIYAEL